ncbi:MAG: PD40 domain-containing protein [Deltaproteobacteria bacterium]|nr:PD40 domain-containing protein [Deltaproteobacteria bacterium]
MSSQGGTKRIPTASFIPVHAPVSHDPSEPVVFARLTPLPPTTNPSAYASQNAANHYAQAPQAPSRNFWTRGWENFSIFDLIPGVGCSASLGVNESNADAGATDRPDGFVSVCNTYAPFTPLASIRPNTPLNAIVLGGPNGEFVCYQEWNYVPPRDPLPPSTYTPYVDGYAILNRGTGGITRLPIVHNQEFSSRTCSLSDDGRYAVVIESPHAAGPEQILLVDLQNPNSPRRLTAGDASSVAGVISADGSTVYFISRASNLTSDFNGNGGIFAYDVARRTMSRLPLPSDIHFPVSPLDGTLTQELALSADGNRLVFTANSNSSDDVLYAQVYLFDRRTNNTIRLSSSISGQEGSHYSLEPYISGDGRRVLFTSASDNLIPGTTGFRTYHAILWEEGRGLRLLSTTPDGRPLGSPNYFTRSDTYGISRDGSRAFITSSDPQILPDMWNTLPPGYMAAGAQELLALDLNTGRRSLIYQSLCLGLRFGIGAISPDGRYGVGSFMGIDPETNNPYAYPLLGFGVDYFLDP